MGIPIKNIDDDGGFKPKSVQTNKPTRAELQARARAELARRKKAQQTPTNVDTSQPEKSSPPPASPKEKQPKRQNLPEGYDFDPKTGKTYKRLAAADPKDVKKSNKGQSISVEKLFEITTADPDFDIDNLAETAELFMGHLRVPNSKEQQEELVKRKADYVAEQKRKQKALEKQEHEKDNSEGLL